MKQVTESEFRDEVIHLVDMLLSQDRILSDEELKLGYAMVDFKRDTGNRGV